MSSESLRQACRNKFKFIFESLKLDTSTGSSILVTDDATLKILGSFLKMSELVNYGISAIEKLSLKRKRFQKLDAIYLLSHNPESVERLLNDYLDEETAQYASVDVFFTTTIHSTTMDRIAHNEVLAKRIKTFKELHLEYLCASEREFTLEILGTEDNSFRSLYSEKGMAYQKAESTSVNRLASIVASFPRFYSVQILYGKSEACNVGEKIALGLNNLLQSMFQDFANTNCPQYDKKAPKITVVILDRGYDPVSPLVRDFHYLPMLADLKQNEFDNFTIEYNDTKYSKKMRLDQLDEIYTKYRYRHIAELLTGVSEDFKAFIENNTAAKFQKNKNAENNLNTNKMADLLKKIPQYQETKEKYSLHTKLISDLFDTYKDRGLNTVGELEQTIITGINGKGNSDSDKIIFNNLMAYLEKEKDPSVRARLATLGLFCLELKSSQRSQLESFLEKMGSPFNLVPKALFYLTGSKVVPKLRESREKSNVILDRHMPKIQHVLNQLLVKGNKGDLKSLKLNPQGKLTLGPIQTKKKLGQITSDQSSETQKLIVYIAGGIGYNEIRCVNKFSNKYTVVSGSNCIMNPTEYLRKIGSMMESKGGSSVVDQQL